ARVLRQADRGGCRGPAPRAVALGGLTATASPPPVGAASAATARIATAASHRPQARRFDRGRADRVRWRLAPARGETAHAHPRRKAKRAQSVAAEAAPTGRCREAARWEQRR